MEKLTDYIRWVGDLDFHAYPFREADALILCNIVYFDLTSVFSDGQASHPVSDCIPMIEAGDTRLMITGGDLGNRAIFEAAARSKRFGSLLMHDYEDEFRIDPPLQFTAVTFRAPDFSFIAYRGTDASVAGWRESCMISFTRTEAQQRALAYAERVIDDGAWYIAGHSKGANSAQYAACLLSEDKWEKVRHIWLFDGPGFCPEVLDPALEQRIDPKATRVIPEFDVIGKLFEPKITDTRIVRSSARGIMQHALASWLIDHGDLAAAERNDPLGEQINHLLNDWIESIPQKDRPVFIGELFDAVSADGVQSLEELDPDRLQAILFELTGVSRTTKKALQILPNKLLLGDEIPPIKEEKSEKIQRILADQRIKGAALLLGGALLILLSRFALELTTIAVVAGLAVVQLGLSIVRVVRQHGRFGKMRGRIFILAAILTIAAALCFKEQALYVVGSGLYGILCLALSYYAVGTGLRQRKNTVLRVLKLIEGVLIGLYGIGFLLIPQSIVRSLTISLGICACVDALVRFGYWIAHRLKERKKRRAVRSRAKKS